MFNSALSGEKEVKHFAKIPDFFSEMGFNINTADVSCDNSRHISLYFQNKKNKYKTKTGSASGADLGYLLGGVNH